MPAGDDEMVLGRLDECRRIDDLLAAARSGRGGSLVIRGEAGIGKTTLLERAVDVARDSGMRVLRACGAAFESELPYSTLYGLVRPVLALLDELPAPQADALRAAFAIGGTGPVNRLAAYGATLNLIAAVAERTPVLCAVDDAHWIDRASAEALLFAARRLLAERVAIVFTARRPGGEGLDAPGIANMVLMGLDEAAGVRLATAAGMAPAAAVHLVAATAGNPLALVELPATLTAAQRSGRVPLDDPLPAASRVEAAFLGQARLLPDAAWRALVTCAVSETEELATVERALARGGLALWALDPAVAAGLVTVPPRRTTEPGDGTTPRSAADPVGVRFRHPLVRSAVHAAAGPGLRRWAHLAVASVLTSDDEADRRAWHFAAAASGPDEVVATALAETAERALRRGGVVAQARAFERSARLTPDPDLRADRLVRAMWAWSDSGAGDHAVALADEVRALTGRSGPRCEAARMRAFTALRLGDLTAVGDAYLAEAESYAATDPAGAARMLGGAINRCWAALDLPLLLRVCRRLSELADSAADESSGQRAGWLKHKVQWAAAQVVAGRPEGADLARACVPACASVPADGTAAELAEVLLWLGEHTTARALLEPEIAAARQRNDVLLLAYALTRLAGLESRTGRLRAAHRAAAEAVQIAEQIGFPSQRAHALTMLAVVDALLGNEADCRAHADLAVRIGPPGYRDVAARARYAVGIAAIQAGRYRDAVDALEWIDETTRDVGLVEPNWLPVAGHLAESYVHLKRPDRAIAVIERLEYHGTRLGRRTALAAASRCRGLLAADDAVDDAFKAALAACDDLDAPLERAQTLLCFGQRLRRARRRRDARHHLADALARFETAGAAGWAELCRREIRATGRQAEQRDDRARELTPQQWQVALNAAQGLTNREIAVRVYLSPKTVDYHLGHIYRKLGLRSRQELIRRLSREPTTGNDDG
ncbi:helix-turn-helix transcriptional regulator [Virgisporangium aurantiacum]|uniref:helix-turn-helix transcriptional regulator n=1 Tax=Virgisporangium aurantiacum TaxID=175570 RepID=UPI001950122E|nr:helix-turn-helix transcriptional regulator [Virgisporangium aurantiacum]